MLDRLSLSKTSLMNVWHPGILAALLGVFTSQTTLATVFGPDTPRDIFVSRPHPLKHEALARGNLGILLTSYHRDAMYEAYRALQLGRDVVRAQSIEAFKEPESNEEKAIDQWLTDRQTINSTALSNKPEYFRKLAADHVGSFYNCTPGAFDLARQNLNSLKTNRDVAPTELRQWLDAQDAVFSNCHAQWGQTANIPMQLAASSKPLLRQLRQYQVAAAQFYAGQYAASITNFDAITEQALHPMRSWATLASMRAKVRQRSLDFTWQRHFASQQGLQGAEREANLRRKALELNALDEQALIDIQAHARKITGDSGLASIHEAARKLEQEALRQIFPQKFWLQLGDDLNNLQRNPYTQKTLSRWQEQSEQLFDLISRQPDWVELRKRWAYMDWTRTIQSCTSNPASPNFGQRCPQEHAYALEQWQRQPGNLWLVASLMTADRSTPANQSAIDAALRTPLDNMSALTLHYHAARVLHASGQVAPSMGVVDKLLALPDLDVSSTNLLRQLRVANSNSWAEAMPHLLRSPLGNSKALLLAADGDWLLNQSMTASEMLKQAQPLAQLSPPAQRTAIQRELVLAAWFRAHLLSQDSVAQQAVQTIQNWGSNTPAIVQAYLAATTAQERSDALLLTMVNFHLYPSAFAGNLQAAGQRRNPNQAPRLWCSFSPSDALPQQRIERMPSIRLNQGNTRESYAELEQLQKLGSGAQWFTKQVFSFVQRKPQHRQNTALLKAAKDSAENFSCPLANAQEVMAQADRLLASLPKTVGVSDAEIRAEYDRVFPAQDIIEYDVRHILVRTEAQAREALDLIRTGTPFDSIARRMSADPGSAKNGGSLGWSQANHFTPAFTKEMVLLAPLGMSSQPVQSPFGWHIIEVRNTRKVKPPSYDLMKDRIREALESKQ